MNRQGRRDVRLRGRIGWGVAGVGWNWKLVRWFGDEETGAGLMNCGTARLVAYLVLIRFSFVSCLAPTRPTSALDFRPFGRLIMPLMVQESYDVISEPKIAFEVIQIKRSENQNNESESVRTTPTVQLGKIAFLNVKTGIQY